MLNQAGAIDAGTITLEDSFFSQDGADQLKSIVANTLPAGAQLSETQLDPGTHAGEALGAGSVSYTHLDVYKRQLSTHSVPVSVKSA